MSIPHPLRALRVFPLPPITSSPMAYFPKRIRTKVDMVKSSGIDTPLAFHDDGHRAGLTDRPSRDAAGNIYFYTFQ